MSARPLIVCSGGGHLTEALYLAREIPEVEQLQWATPSTPQSEVLLARESVWPITNVGPRQLGRTLALFPSAFRVIRAFRPTVVISTGASPAIPFLVVAAMKGIPVHYVESLTRIDTPSLTGRILARLPRIQCHSQYGAFGRGWLSIRSPFDDYESLNRAGQHRPIRRVVVTLGTLQDYPFRSLVDRLIEILPSEAEVLWQTGCTDVSDLPIAGRKLVPADEMREAIHAADLVAGHAGCGTTLDALAAGLLPVLVPRRSKRGEHVDDHQAQVAGHLGDRGLAVTAEVEELTAEHLQRAADGGARPVDDAGAAVSVTRSGRKA